MHHGTTQQDNFSQQTIIQQAIIQGKSSSGAPGALCNESEVARLSALSFTFGLNSSLSISECKDLAAITAFVNARELMPEHLLGFMSPYSVTEYANFGARLFLTSDSAGGFGLIGGQLCSVFSHPGKHYGHQLVAFAKALGAERLTCYDFNGFLGDLYKQHGFVESERHSWRCDLAPANWNYARWGRPDYLIMELK